MHEYTEDEVRTAFLEHVWTLIDYWDGKYDHTVALKPCRKKMEGLAFSILVTLDGESADLPGFVVAPCPHPDDREYHRERGENWYPENHDALITCDISGSLHEEFHTVRKGEHYD